MTVRLDELGAILLEDICPVEEAESLLVLLQAHPNATVDWSGCRKLHTALVQVLLATRPEIRGECGDQFIHQWLGQMSARFRSV